MINVAISRAEKVAADLESAIAKQLLITCRDIIGTGGCGGELIIVGWTCTICEKCGRRRGLSRGQAVTLRRLFPHRISETEADRQVAERRTGLGPKRPRGLFFLWFLMLAGACQ